MVTKLSYMTHCVTTRGVNKEDFSTNILPFEKLLEIAVRKQFNEFQLNIWVNFCSSIVSTMRTWLHVRKKSFFPHSFFTKDILKSNTVFYISLSPSIFY